MALDHMPARPCATLRTSSDERHQNRPYSNQTKHHPGSGDIGAHRPSPSVLGDRARVALWPNDAAVEATVPLRPPEQKERKPQACRGWGFGLPGLRRLTRGTD
jgi:hypothetical protein